MVGHEIVLRFIAGAVLCKLHHFNNCLPEEKDMSNLLKSKEQLQKEYEDAEKCALQEGMSIDTINYIKTGRSFEGDNTPEVCALKVAWSRLHPRL